MLPASVARFRIWTEPTTAAASASASVVAPDPLVGGDVGHHRPRADRAGRPSVSRISAVELGDPLDVDDDPRPDRPVAQPDDQVGAAGQQPRVRAVLGEQGDGVVEAGRPLVGEGAHRPA